jgi:Domain of unknown function (DUF5666)
VNLLSQPGRCHSGVTPASVVLFLLLALCGYFAIDCGSGGMSSGTVPPPALQPTSVTVVVSSNANGQFANFYVDITSISLKNRAGTTVSVLAAPQSPTFTQTQEAEFIHLNGQMAPFLTAMVPQDVYTSATLTYSYAQFTHVRLNASGGLETVTDAVGPNSTTQTATVSLPSPLTIRGSAMAVSLDLQVSPSATFTDQGAGQPDIYGLTPMFTLAPVAAMPQSQVQVMGVDGLVSSINSGSNSLTLVIDYGFNNPSFPDGSTFTIATNATTVYQGIGNFSALAAGMIANLDLTLQSDGSLLATRIEVDDPGATNVLAGPLGTVFGAQGNILELGRTNEEFNQNAVPGSNFMPYSLDAGTAFKLSGEIAVPSNLPFSATFDSSNLIAGQNVAIASQVIVTSGGTNTHATTITLMPQTINGTITGVSSSGGFTVYTVSLAAYDLFPILAVQPGQTTALQNPSSVEVYVDSNTQMLNSNAIAPGNVLRFNGLIFNDSGTARMVCGQVNDGVAE